MLFPNGGALGNGIGIAWNKTRGEFRIFLTREAVEHTSISYYSAIDLEETELDHENGDPPHFIEIDLDSKVRRR